VVNLVCVLLLLQPVKYTHKYPVFVFGSLSEVCLQRVMNLSREQKVALRRECQSYIKKLETMFQKRRQLVAALKVSPSPF
jgi:hypothetical protein